MSAADRCENRAERQYKLSKQGSSLAVGGSGGSRLTARKQQRRRWRRKQRPSSLVDQDKIATFEHLGAVYTKDQKRAFCLISIDRAPTLPSKT
ncbi:hypothetical protein NL676_021153 [Syzygium grande]|nr:hypothetical protein NL676_021153 [Syzygium grande]